MHLFGIVKPNLVNGVYLLGLERKHSCGDHLLPLQKTQIVCPAAIGGPAPQSVGTAYTVAHTYMQANPHTYQIKPVNIFQI